MPCMGDSEDDLVEIFYGFAPGVDATTNTFTCPRCKGQRDCQSLNPLCLVCGYQDPRNFLPAPQIKPSLTSRIVVGLARFTLWILVGIAFIFLIVFSAARESRIWSCW